METRIIERMGKRERTHTHTHERERERERERENGNRESVWRDLKMIIEAEGKKVCVSSCSKNK